jgi:hypothetical protein
VLDNDGAGDLLAGFWDASLDERAGIVRDALRAAAGEPGYLEVDEGQAAIAAAAVLAAGRAGRPVVDGGRVIEAGGLPAADPGLLALAVRALDRVTGGDSEWRELWQESPDLEAALSAVAQVRAALI